MTELIIGGAGVIIISLLAWFAMRAAHRAGAAQQRADDIAEAHETEGAIRDIQAERRDTEETKKRMREGRF